MVLFDVNRPLKFGPLIRPATEAAIGRLLPPLPQRYRITVIANVDNGVKDTVARTIAPGQTTEEIVPLGIDYSQQILPLSHVAIPFPLDDALYGLEPNPDEDFGANLGTIAARGERGALIVNLDSLFRIASNPFFPYVVAQIEEGMADPAPAIGALDPGADTDHWAPTSQAPTANDYLDPLPQPAEDP